MNKRGEDVSYETIIFIIVVTIFFFLLFAFVYRASNGAQIYEESYAKEIAMFLDGAKPGMTISFDLGKAFVVAKSKEIPVEKIVRFDSSSNSVIVSLSDSGGYSFQYFSDLDFKIIRFPDYVSDNDKIVIKAEVKNE